MKKQRILLAGMLLAGTTLFAGCNIKFNSIRYNVDFYVDGEVYKTVGTDGKNIEMPANPTKDGYQFDGWYTEENGEGELITLYTLLNQPLSEDIRLNIYAHFLEELTVSFVTGTDEVISDAKYVEGDTMSALNPTITPEDMLFNGWFTDEDCTKKWDEETELTEDLTLYAGWITKSVTVTYVYNMEGMENTTVEATRFERTPEVTPDSTEEDTFIGWYKDKNLTIEWSFDNTVDRDLTLYAKWLSKYVTVTYDFQHKDLENKTVKIERGQQATALQPEQIPLYHDFLGWCKYAYGGTKWNFDNPVEKDMTLYADWDDHTGEYVRVTYVYVDGDTYYDSTEIGSLVDDRTNYQPLKDGERFVGWFLDENFTQPWDILNDRADKTEITLYAKAERVQYNLTFDTQGVESFPARTVYYGDSISFPTLHKEDYYVAEWLATKADGTTFTVYPYWGDFTYTHNQETDICFTPVFKSIYTFEKLPFDEAYALSDIYFVEQETLRIPAEYNGLPVTKIKEEACRNNNYFNKLILPDSVTHIGEDAFSACYALTEVTLGSGLTEIGLYAFQSCSELVQVTFTGNSLKKIASNVFMRTKISTLTLPDSVESLGSMGYCDHLATLHLGSGLKEITGGFYDCKALKELRLPASLLSMPENAFDGCNVILYAEAKSKPDGWADNWHSNMPVVWNANEVKTLTQNGLLYAVNGESATVVRYSGNAKELTVPEQVTIDGVSYPVTEFGSNAFYLATALCKLSLPNSLEKVNQPQFIGCNALQYHVENGVAYLGNAENPYFLLKDLTANQQVLTIPAKTRIILGHSPDYAYTTYSIKGLAFEQGSQLKHIGPTFYYWGGAGSDFNIYLPAGVKYISTGAFRFNYLHVFVPEETAPEGWELGWNAYDKEMSNPCVVHYGISLENMVTVNEATYILKGDEATLLKLESTTDTYVLPDIVTVDGKEYTLTAITGLALSYTKANLTYLAIPETVREMDLSRGDSPKFNINAYLVASNAVPEGYNPCKANIFYGVTEHEYILTENAHYIALGDYAMAYRFTGNGSNANPIIYAVPKTVTVNGSDLPVSHISRSFIAGAQYTSVLLQETVTYIPTGKTYGYGTKFFTTHTSQPVGWEADWNETYGGGNMSKSYMPVTYGVKGFTEDVKTYSFVTDGTAVETLTAAFIPTEPISTLENKVFWGWYDNPAFSGDAVEFPYTGASTTFYARFENGRRQDGKSQETAFDLTLGTYIPVEIKIPGQTVYFKLDVTEQTTYLFKSRGDCDTFGKIYYMKKVISILREETVASADGGGSGENFSMSATLSKNTYYFTVKLTESSKTGSFEIIVSAA